jgi:hypothetical protein
LNDIKNLFPGITNLYSGKIIDTTSINELFYQDAIGNKMGKIVIVMDTTLYPNYSLLCPDLVQYIGMENSNTQKTTQTFNYSNLPEKNLLSLNTDKYSCNVKSLYQVLFLDENSVSYSTNVNTDILFKNYSIQIIPMMFWNNTYDLQNYEMLFNKCGGGIIPLSCIYKNVIKKTDEYINYPNPVLANPIYGGQTTSIIIIVACLGVTGFIIMKEYQ